MALSHQLKDEAGSKVLKSVFRMKTTASSLYFKHEPKITYWQPQQFCLFGLSASTLHSIDHPVSKVLYYKLDEALLLLIGQGTTRQALLFGKRNEAHPNPKAQAGLEKKNHSACLLN